MKAIGGRRLGRRGGHNSSGARLATNVPKYTVTFHTDMTAPESHERYVANTESGPQPTFLNFPADVPQDNAPSLPLLFGALDEPAGAVPAYETTTACDEEAAKKRQNVAHMDELKAEEAVFLQMLLGLHHHSQLLTPCACGVESRLRKVACRDCVQPELLCRQCWVNKHRTMPTHWAFIWNAQDRFFEKSEFCRVLKNSAVVLGHYGAGIFPGSVKEPKTGYTLGVLEAYREERNQGKGSAYDFVCVLQRKADPFFAGAVPDIYINFLPVSRFHQYLEVVMRRGQAHGVDVPLPGELNRPYPNRPIGFLGLNCGACPERGVNMPLLVNVPKYLRHLVSQHFTLDGNFKANLFFKRDNGSERALTDSNMYFPRQEEFNKIAKEYVVPDEDKEVPCNSHIGSIRNQGTKYGNTAISGVGEAFALGTYATRELLRHTNSPPQPRACRGSLVGSYDSYCAYEVNQLKRAVLLFPEDTWLHELLETIEGQTPADHINGHGQDCQCFWQPVYFACRAHFHGETAEMLWAFLNPLGASTRQMTAGGRHDIISFVMDTWNMWKVLRQAELLAAERLDALKLFELHMAVVVDLSRQHATEVAAWSQLSRLTTRARGKKPRSVYQHESTKVLTLDHMLASMIAEEGENATRERAQELRTSVAKWIHDGMMIERDQLMAIALLGSHRKHPLQETWTSITTLRDSLNLNLKIFREHQREIYPRLTLSALELDEPELTAIQLPSYHMKHGQRPASGGVADDEDSQLREREITLRCTQATDRILAVRAACLALSAVKKARGDDYRGQAGITRSQRNLQKAELMKDFRIAMYNKARAALIHMGHMAEDDTEPFAPLGRRDTRRKDTHLHRAKGDLRLFDGTAWYLQSGTTIREAASAPLSPNDREQESEEDDPQLLTGTQTLKRSGHMLKSPRVHKRLKDIAPDDVLVEPVSSEAEDSDDLEASPSKLAKERRGKGKGKPKKSDGWIWLEKMTRGQTPGDETKLAEYKAESDRVQWFRAEAEMYRWLEAYERKHAELMRVDARFSRDNINGTVSFARMHAAMYKRLAHNAKVIFKSADSGAHHDWATATTLDELVIKVDRWRDVVFKWMDDMGIHRAYKDF
ncbi:hypothetical protein B0H10DRAFT_2207466 [Mycena sp. CBHHK59/15]|nr:hypothetical protein B0H10DRAFT_2207466 [Mycena sp. CBHHK59/15]